MFQFFHNNTENFTKMSNRENFLPFISLVQQHRFLTDQSKLPDELKQIIHPNGGNVEFSYYENCIVNGFTIKTWYFEPTSTWLDLISALQTTFKRVSDIYKIVPNKDAPKQSCISPHLQQSIAEYNLKNGDMEKYNKQMAAIESSKKNRQEMISSVNGGPNTQNTQSSNDLTQVEK